MTCEDKYRYNQACLREWSVFSKEQNVDLLQERKKKNFLVLKHTLSLS